MAGEPTQQPKRPKGFFEGVMLDWRQAALRGQLTDHEHVTVAAQYLGLCVAHMDLSVESQIEVLTAAAKISHTSCLSRMAVKQGAAWPLQPNLRAAGNVRP